MDSRASARSHGAAASRPGLMRSVEAWHRLPGARLRLRVEVVAVMTDGTGCRSGVRSDGLFCVFISSMGRIA